MIGNWFSNHSIAITVQKVSLLWAGTIKPQKRNMNELKKPLRGLLQFHLLIHFLRWRKTNQPIYESKWTYLEESECQGQWYWYNDFCQNSKGQLQRQEIKKILMLILLIKAGLLNKVFFFQISQFVFIILVTDFFTLTTLSRGMTSNVSSVLKMVKFY